MIDIASDTPAINSHCSFRRIDSNAFHHCQIDDQAVVDAAKARPVVAAAAHSDRKFIVAAEINRRNNIGHIATARDGQRSLVDHRVVQLSGFLIIRMIARNDEATEALGEVG